MQQLLQAPVYEKAQATVTELAKAKGLAFVFEETQMLYIDAAQGVNLTTEARAALNIPEGRTIETLQAELQAKAAADQVCGAVSEDGIYHYCVAQGMIEAI